MVDRAAPRHRVALWIVLGFGAFVIAAFAALLVTEPIAAALLAPAGVELEAGTASWGIRLALYPLVWGIATAGAGLALAGRLGLRARPSRGSTVLFGAGLVLAATTMFLVHEFVRTRHGLFDPEYVGVAGLMIPGLVATALLAWAALMLPVADRAPFVPLLVLATLGICLVLVPSLPGLGDGIRVSSVPLAASLGVDVAYGAGCLIAVAGRRRRRPS